MQDKKTFIEKENEENNNILKSLSINKKIAKKGILFLLCSLLYFIMAVDKRDLKVIDIHTQAIHSFISYIMIFCYAVALICLVGFILIKINKKIGAKADNLPYKTKRKFFTFLDWSIILPICCVISTFCLSYLFTFAVVSGESMMPTIENDTRVFVSYLDKIDRSDVIVAYITPEDFDLSCFSEGKLAEYPQYYIKRVIGLPGDTVTWIDGILKINGEEFDEFYFSEETKKHYQSIESFNFYGKFKYIKDGKIEYSNVIPDDYFFIMGDHRDNSTDSRIIGLVPRKNISGVVKCRMGLLFPKGAIV